MCCRCHSAFFRSLTNRLPPQTTALGRASPRWTTRCVKASSQASCAQRPCAAPLWDGRGVTPARCAQPSLTPADEGSYQTTAPGRAKVKSVPQHVCLFFCFCIFVFLCHFPSHFALWINCFYLFEYFNSFSNLLSLLSLRHPLICTHHPLSRGLLLIGLNWGGWQCLPHVYGMPADARCGGTVRVSNTGQWQCHVGELISGQTAPCPPAPDPTTSEPLQGRQTWARAQRNMEYLETASGHSHLRVSSLSPAFKSVKFIKLI